MKIAVRLFLLIIILSAYFIVFKSRIMKNKNRNSLLHYAPKDLASYIVKIKVFIPGKTSDSILGSGTGFLLNDYEIIIPLHVWSYLTDNSTFYIFTLSKYDIKKSGDISYNIKKINIKNFKKLVESVTYYTTTLFPDKQNYSNFSSVHKQGVNVYFRKVVLKDESLEKILDMYNDHLQFLEKISRQRNKEEDFIYNAPLFVDLVKLKFREPLDRIKVSSGFSIYEDPNWYRDKSLLYDNEDNKYMLVRWSKSEEFVPIAGRFIVADKERTPITEILLYSEWKNKFKELSKKTKEDKFEDKQVNKESLKTSISESISMQPILTSRILDLQWCCGVGNIITDNLIMFMVKLWIKKNSITAFPGDSGTVLVKVENIKGEDGSIKHNYYVMGMFISVLYNKTNLDIPARMAFINLPLLKVNGFF